MQEDLDTHIFEFHFLSKSIESPNWTSLTCISYASSISTAKKNISPEVENAWDAEEARPFQVFIPIELCFV